MKNVLIDLVISLNGMLARDDGEEDWLPEDGWEEFLTQIDKFQNVIIGRDTYELVKAKYEHENFDAINSKLKIILSTQSAYKAPTKDYLVAHSPEEAIAIVQAAGLETAYVGGGGKVCAAFLNAGLADRLQLKIMPYIIPSGRSFVAGLAKDVSLQLLQSSQRKDGSLTNLYKVN